MKYIKLSLTVLLLAIVTNFVMVKAGVIYSRLTIIEFLTKQETNYTRYFEKNDWFVPSYENVDTFTSLTNPCPKCVILVRAHEKGGDATAGLLTKMNNTYTFSNTSPVPGEWRLSLSRYDATLLNTTTKGYWYLNENGNIN